jgi:hypothetical protein
MFPSEFKNVRNLLKAGKKCEGYQTIQDIVHQSMRAMDILGEDYGDEKHVLAYDNATIHTACAPDALSTTKMTAKPSENFNKIKHDDGTTPWYACTMRAFMMALHSPLFPRLLVQGDENHHPGVPCKRQLSS